MPSFSSTDNLDEIARLAGAIPGPRTVGFNPNHAVQLLPIIKGKSAYLKALDKAAVALYELLSQNGWIRSLANSQVELPGKTKGTIPRLPPRPSKAILAVLKHLLHSLAFVASSPLTKNDGRETRRECVALPMSPGRYGKEREYDLSFRSMQAMILALAFYQPDEQGPWLEVVRGNDYGEGWLTRIAASDAFKTWMLHHGLVFQMHPTGPVKHHSKANKSLLWKSEKVDVDSFGPDKAKYPLDRPLQGDETILPEVNARLSKAKVECRFPDYAAYWANWNWSKGRSRLPHGPEKLYRIFAEEDGRGGRLFGHWVQRMKSDQRRSLTIKGLPTVELDYGSMQLVLLYAMAGIPVPEGDLYDPDGKGQTHREWMKTVLVVSVGCCTRTKTIRALERKLREKKEFKKGEAERYYDEFWNRHQAVCPHGKYSEAMWSILQFAESSIALRVLRYLEERKIIVIPIHDGFIVQARYEAMLRNAMERAFEDYFPGAIIRIKKA